MDDKVFKGGTRRNAARTNFDEKRRRPNSSEAHHSRVSDAAKAHEPLKVDKSSAAGPSTKTVPNCDDKPHKQMDVKHKTMLTNLASSYYEKIKSKTLPEYIARQIKAKIPSKYYKEEALQSDNAINSLSGINVRENAYDAYTSRDRPILNHREKNIRVVITNNNPSSETEIRMGIPNQEPCYFKKSPRKSPKRTGPNLTNEAAKLTQHCCTDVKVLKDTGTSPTNSQLEIIFDVNRQRNKKSSIPVKNAKPTKNVMDSLQKINFIVDEVRELGEEINDFTGSSMDHRDYVYMDEVMMRNLIKLDNIDTQNDDTIRSKRKEAIRFIQNSMNLLQRKLNENRNNPDLDNISIAIDSLENVNEINSNSQTIDSQDPLLQSTKSEDREEKDGDQCDFKEMQDLYELESQALSVIREILESTEKLRLQIENFSGSSPDDKEYMYLDEMMIRCLVALDELESNGNMVIKQERKRAVQYVQKLLKMLDSRLRENREALQQFIDSDDEI